METALMHACKNKLENVALALIKDERNPGDVDIDGNTALTYACSNKLVNVALALINLGPICNPGQIDENGYTALIYACIHKLENVALALINLGPICNPGHLNYNSNVNSLSALSVVKENNLKNVHDALVKLLPKINIAIKAHETVEGLDYKIKDFLTANPEDNIVFMFDKHYRLLKRSELETQIEDPNILKYECKTAGDKSIHVMLDNFVGELHNPSYMYIPLLLIGFQFSVRLIDVENIIQSNDRNVYALTPSGKKLKSIISHSMRDQIEEDGAAISGSMSADHCQPGKETEIYNITEALTVEEEEEVVVEVVESKDFINTIYIQYKGKIYDFQKTDNSNLDKLINDFRTQLIEEDTQISGIKIREDVIIRFIHAGKVLKPETDISNINGVIQAIVTLPLQVSVEDVVLSIGGRTKRVKKGGRTKRVKKGGRTKRVKKPKRKYTKKAIENRHKPHAKKKNE